MMHRLLEAVAKHGVLAKVGDWVFVVCVRMGAVSHVLSTSHIHTPHTSTHIHTSTHTHISTHPHISTHLTYPHIHTYSHPHIFTHLTYPCSHVHTQFACYIVIALTVSLRTHPLHERVKVRSRTLPHSP